MSKIKEKFEELQERNEKALISYIMAGFPNEKSTISVVRGLVKGGVDIIELGFPFSDPLADGPVIQNASTISLEKGTKIDKFFSLVKKIRKETDTPLILMTYTNILYHKGYSKFIAEAKKAGIDGFILPDMSIEESEDYLKAAKNNADTIFLISPNTSKTRIAKIAKANSLNSFVFVSSGYADSKSSGDYLKYKGEVEEELKRLNFPKLGIMRPSFLLGDRKEKRIGEKIGIFVFNLLSPLFLGPLKKMKPIHSEIVARSMIKFANEDLQKNTFESNEIAELSLD